MQNTNIFKKKPLAAAVTALSVPALVVLGPDTAVAQDNVIEMIVVTATRRAESVQDVPINITAVTGDEIAQQGLRNLSELSQWVPGLYIVDQGARAADMIIARGLNADPLAASEGLGNAGGETVATYVGEIPLYVNLQLNDLQRVEVLMGPQGTLYGAGTLGGAIRYMPNKPDLGGQLIKVRGDVYGYSEGDDLSSEVGFTFNQPVSDTVAFRASVDYLKDEGFIDYQYLVREAGVSNPDPDFSDPADVSANLKSGDDANDVETWSGRAAMRWQPSERFDATLTYWFQDEKAGARTINGRDALGTGRWESALRVPEPNDRDNELFSLEMIADLGFAELTSATGRSEYEENGQRDQTDLLISLQYSYEDFPSFTAYTLEEVDEDTWTQEIRLVSTWDKPWNWIVGGFYNDWDQDESSKEFTPNFDLFAINVWGTPGVPRPDSIEYYAVDHEELEETALFGELSYDFSNDWQVTVGYRLYSYELDTSSAVDLPLLFTSIDPDGRAPDEFALNFVDGGQSDDGDLWKFNTSYHFTEDLMAYATYSEGYRIGASNGVVPCSSLTNPVQTVCALPGEEDYQPDETTNYELGLRSTWLDGRLVVNGSAYYIEWDDPQVSSATVFGLQPITINGDGAETKGLELSTNWLITDRLTLRANYSYVKAELTDDVPNLIKTISPPGFDVAFEDGQDGDRLPGSPENKGSLFLSYARPVFGNYLLELDYGVTAQSDVLTRADERGDGESLDGFAIHNVSARVSRDNWSATLYANNVTDKYAETGVRDTGVFVQDVSDINGGTHRVRRYFKNVLPPRAVGLRVTWELGN